MKTMKTILSCSLLLLSGCAGLDTAVGTVSTILQTVSPPAATQVTSTYGTLKEIYTFAKCKLVDCPPAPTVEGTR